MEITTWNSVFNWIGIIASLFVLISALGTYWTGKVIGRMNDSKVIALETQVENLSPRELSDQQRSILLSALSQSPSKVSFMSKMLDPEARNFATQFSNIFESAGWEIGAVQQDLLDDFGGQINIFMTGNVLNSEIQIRTVTIPAFDNAGIEYMSKSPRSGSFGGNLRENTLYIQVGSRKAN